MKIRFFISLSILILATSFNNVFAQADTVINQITNSNADSLGGGTSGDGRIVVFESNGNVATENPRNEDGNREIFVFDYAQRRIFQITDTKSVSKDESIPAVGFNTKVLVDSTRPVISNDGAWIAFASNATTSVPGSPANGSNPGNFDGDSFSNSTRGADPLILTDAEGGEMFANIVQPTVPTVVRIQFTDINESITGFSVTVDGTDANNNPVTETFTFADGLNQVGTQIFATITSVTLDSLDGTATNDTLNFYYGDNSNPLVQDGNMEIWMFGFQTPPPTIDLSQGTEVPYNDLAAGTFIQVTNTETTRLPLPGTFSTGPVIASDNTDASISDNGSTIAFVSNRNLVGTGNEAPQDNPEIFTYIRGSATTSQVTRTNRGQIFEPIYNNVPNLSGNGMRVMFTSNANNPVDGMTGGDNTDLNEEIFYADLNPMGEPSGNNKQVTNTSPDNPGNVVNIVNFGKRMSRDGKYIAFDSFADLTNQNNGENQDAFATFLYNADTDTFDQISIRSDADDAATGGDINRYPTFTDYVAGSPQTLVLVSRMNINPDGTLATAEGGGLNPIPERPAQVYSFPVSSAVGEAEFTRLTFLPPPPLTLATIQIHPSNSLKRTPLTVPSTEIGAGNRDLSTEVFYLLNPEVTTEEEEVDLNFLTATGQIVTNDPVPAQSPEPSPTPQSPPAVQGLSAGSLAKVTYDAGTTLPTSPVTAEGSFDRRFSLPMELGGVTMSINGVSVGLKRVTSNEITFVIPPGFGSNFDVPFPVVINNNGVQIKGDLILVPSRPEILRFEDNSNNRARVLNITNRVFTREPFDVQTLRYRGGVKIPTILRLFLTGVEGIPGDQITLRIGDVPISSQITNPVAVEPGIYAVEFTLSPEHQMLGDQPFVIITLAGENTFFGRLDSDAPRVRIL